MSSTFDNKHFQRSIAEELEDLKEEITDFMLSSIRIYMRRAKDELTQGYYAESVKGKVLRDQLSNYTVILQQFKDFDRLIKEINE